ncbi:hypothetical protein B0H19DRAFT_1174101 [Mycena capillaripes]|nr:hypothetical protein B0H19DRAFT_1174101 [Mycena capillaripes]
MHQSVIGPCCMIPGRRSPSAYGALTAERAHPTLARSPKSSVAAGRSTTTLFLALPRLVLPSSEFTLSGSSAPCRFDVTNTDAAIVAVFYVFVSAVVANVVPVAPLSSVCAASLTNTSAKPGAGTTYTRPSAPHSPPSNTSLSPPRCRISPIHANYHRQIARPARVIRGCKLVVPVHLEVEDLRDVRPRRRRARSSRRGRRSIGGRSHRSSSSAPSAAHSRGPGAQRQWSGFGADLHIKRVGNAGEAATGGRSCSDTARADLCVLCGRKSGKTCAWEEHQRMPGSASKTRLRVDDRSARIERRRAIVRRVP